MQPDYVKMELREQSRYTWLKQVLPDAIRYRLFYQPACMQVQADCLGDFQGLCVVLPFAKEELADIRMEWMQQYLLYIGDTLGVCQAAFFLHPMLAKRFSMEETAYETEFKLLLLKDMTDTLLRKYRLTRQEAQIVVIDDDTWHLQAAVRMLVQGMNHLTIVTRRQPQLEAFAGELLSEYGLAVSWVSSDFSGRLSADLCVNLIAGTEHITTRIDGSCILIDFGYTDRKAVKLTQINPHMQIYHAVKLKSVQDTVDLPDMSRILYHKEPLFRQFVAGGFGADGLAELLGLWDRYFVEMVRVY